MPTSKPMPDVLTVPIPIGAGASTDALRWCETHIGRGFHPDRRGGDYLDLATDELLFTPDQAEHLDAVLEAVFEQLPDPYGTSPTLIHDLCGTPRGGQVSAETRAAQALAGALTDAPKRAGIVGVTQAGSEDVFFVHDGSLFSATITWIGEAAPPARG